MERSQLSREFSGRVQTNFHRQSDLFRFWIWMVALVVGSAVFLWLIWNSALGSPKIYHAGALSTPHQMFENRCELCHVPFTGPIDRIVSLGRDVTATSAPDQKCIACHEGTGHFFVGDANTEFHERHQKANLVSGHEQHCSECHSEHRGHEDVRRVANAFCTECHGTLQDFAAHAKLVDSQTFQHKGRVAIPDFASHPEFAIHEPLWPGDEDAQLPRSHGANEVIGLVRRQGENQPRWQDLATIRFNHSKHLSPKDPRGIPDARGVFHDLNDDCSRCHQPDAERRSMQPINFEMHCSSCHPLVFDTERVRDHRGHIFTIDQESSVPGEGKLRNQSDPVDVRDISELGKPDSPFELLVVPHQTPQEVRGFLTDFYAMGLLRRTENLSAEPELDQVVRPRPGHADRAEQSPLVPPASLIEIDRHVGMAETLVRSPTFAGSAQSEIPNLFRSMHWLQSSGGCGFCHESSEDSEGNWTITKSNIPDRWFRHARFHHDTHRTLKCVECHSSSGSQLETVEGDAPQPDIYRSSDTGDVLIPKIAVCNVCHSASPVEKNGLSGARTDCVECHVYHKREFEVPGQKDVREFLGITGDPESGKR